MQEVVLTVLGDDCSQLAREAMANFAVDIPTLRDNPGKRARATADLRDKIAACIGGWLLTGVDKKGESA